MPADPFQPADPYVSKVHPLADGHEQSGQGPSRGPITPGEALLGGWLATKLFHVVTLRGFFNVSTWLTAIAGAVILLLAYHLVTSRTTRTRRRGSHNGRRSRRWAHR
jgi:Transglycosylase associated protein